MNDELFVIALAFRRWLDELKPWYIKNSKKVKEHSTVQWAGSVSVFQPRCSLIFPSCCLALVHPKPWLSLNYQWTMFTVKASAVHIFCQNLAVAKSLREQKLVIVFNSWAFFHAQSRAAHQDVTIRTRVCCVWACNFRMKSTLQCSGSSVDLQNLVKIKGVPWFYLNSLCTCSVLATTLEGQSCLAVNFDFCTQKILLTVVVHYLTYRNVKEHRALS
jgi:hypothetical protein